MELNDKAIRSGLKAWLALQHQAETDVVIADEVALAQHRVRADVVVINGTLHGFEIKSPRDTLSRLQEQAYWYSTVFDRVSLVSTPEHVKAALEIIPDWWEVLVVEPCGSIFNVGREGRLNPAQDTYELARLLWAEEAIQLLESHGLMKGLRGKPRYRLHERIAECIGLSELRTYVIASFKGRSDWRDGVQPG